MLLIFKSSISSILRVRLIHVLLLVMMTMLPVDGTRGVVMESSDSIDPPLSQPEASCSQSRNGWVHVGALTFNNEGEPSLGIRIQSIDRNNGVGKESDSSNPRHQSQQLEKLSQSRRPEVPSLPIHVYVPTSYCKRTLEKDAYYVYAWKKILQSYTYVVSRQIS